MVVVLPYLEHRFTRTWVNGGDEQFGVWKSKFLHLDPSLWRSFLWAIASWYLASIWEKDSWSSLMAILYPKTNGPTHPTFKKNSNRPLKHTQDPQLPAAEGNLSIFVFWGTGGLFQRSVEIYLPTDQLSTLTTMKCSKDASRPGSCRYIQWCGDLGPVVPLSSGLPYPQDEVQIWRWRNLEEPNPRGMGEHIVEPSKDQHVWNGDKLTATFSSLCLSWSSCKFDKFDDNCWDSQHLRSTQCHQQIPLYTSPCWNRGCIPFHPFSNQKKGFFMNPSQSGSMYLKKHDQSRKPANFRPQTLCQSVWSSSLDDVLLAPPKLEEVFPAQTLGQKPKSKGPMSTWLKLPFHELDEDGRYLLICKNVNGLLFLKRISQDIITIWIYTPPSSRKKQQDYETFLHHSYDRGSRPKRSFNHVCIIGWGGLYRSKV